jgi:hypothetical protein
MLLLAVPPQTDAFLTFANRGPYHAADPLQGGLATLVKEVLLRKYIVWLFAVALVSMSAPASAQTPKQPDTSQSRTPSGEKADEEKLMALEKQDWELIKKKDWKPFDTLLSRDFVWVDESGVIAGRDEFLKTFSDIDLTDYAMGDVKVTFFSPDMGLVTYKVTEKGSFKGEQLPSKPYYVSSGYVRRDGQWVNVFTQTTLSR